MTALAVALLCAPGTWLRTELPDTSPRNIALARLQGPGSAGAPGWEIEGVWQYSAESLLFGGYSALLAVSGNRLRAFSDRGFRMTLTEPDQSGAPPRISRQMVAREDAHDLWDIESATRDPATGRYWLGYEHRHAIHRFTRESAIAGKRDLTADVDWGANGGAEAMTRLADGRFVILPEGGRKGVIFASDPVEGASLQRFAFRNPAPGFAATDMAQLPDGRLMVLMRDVVWAWPAFTSLIAIGPPPEAGGTFAPEKVLQLDPAIPRENYEGLALRPRADGRIDVWLISDDNLSVMQRTLLAKLIYDPRA